MTETAEATGAATESKSIFAEILAKTGLPPEALATVQAKLDEAFNLIVENNKRVAKVNAAKAADPSKPGYDDELDKLWRLHATDPAIRETEEKYQVVSAEYEKLLKELREFAKTKIETPPSEEEAKNLRKLVNESADTISKAKQSAADMVVMIDTMLALPHINAAVKGGVISLLPEVESLKNVRGRKASATGQTYMTRVGDIEVDGNSTNRIINGESKGKFNFAADELSKQFGEDVFPDNAVDPETLEQAYFDALGKPLRSVKSTEIPTEFEFTFTKDVKVRNSNDDGFKVVPMSKKVKVYRAVAKPTKTETTSEAPKVAADENVEAPAVKPQETLKVSDHVKPEPKKATAPQANQAKK